MEKIVGFSVLDASELSKEDIQLLSAAYYVRLNSQSPYSKYQVGAALKTLNGEEIFVGCNVERATFTQTSHAEQVAVDAAVVRYGPKMRIKKIAIISAPENTGMYIPFIKDMESTIDFMVDSPVKKPNVPCGHCQQIIWENCADENVELIGLHESGMITKTTIGSAFPWKFGPRDLGIE